MQMISRRDAVKSVTAAAVGAFASLAVTAAVAGPDVGAAAPGFTATTATGETINLADFAGKNVVLEWTNDRCPFVVKHYDTGNMQASQQAVVADGDVWISIISSAPGKQGYVDPETALELSESRGATPTHVVLDPTGAIGRAYAAKTTPHMFVIDAEGTVRYDGAMDDKPSTNHATVEGAENYVLAAYTSVANGEAVATSRTKPYGCSVKYGS